MSQELGQTTGVKKLMMTVTTMKKSTMITELLFKSTKLKINIAFIIHPVSIQFIAFFKTYINYVINFYYYITYEY